jgi:type IV pilus assembly protein PilE
MRWNSRGFTLIELMIVVLVVAVLASIAVPSYRQYVLRSHRTEAKAALLNVAAAQEKFYLQNNTYTTALTAAPPAGLGIAATTSNGYYNIAIGGANAATFSVTATATGTQTEDTACASFTIDALGVKSAKNKGNGDNSAACWN